MTNAPANTRRLNLLIAGPMPPPYAGVETFTAMMINSPIIHDRFNVHFCNMQKPIRNEERGRLGWVNLRYNAQHFVELLQICLNARPDVAYLPLSQNRPGFLRDALMALICRPFCRRVVFQIHGSSFDQFYKAQPAWLRAYVRFVFKRVDAFVAGGHNLQRQFDSLVPAHKFYRAAYGVPTTMPTRSDVLENDVIRVLFMGHISFAKGAVTLARALPDVIARVPQKILVQFAGEPIRKERNITFIEEHDNAPEAIEVAAHGLAENVQFCGVLNGNAKLQTLVDADIFVLPSYTEGLSFAVLEAMAAGLPVVMTPVGALPEILQDKVNALHVQPGDVAGLADALVALIRDAARRKQMGQANRTLVETMYNETAFMTRLSETLAAIGTAP